MSISQEKNNEIVEKLKEVDDKKKKADIIIDYVQENEERMQEMYAYSRTYGMGYNKYENVSYYVNTFLEDDKEKIYVAQRLGDYELAKKILDEYDFTDKEREKFDNIKKNNKFYAYSLRPELLSDKFDFLADNIDFVVAANADYLMVNYMVNLDSDELQLFKNCYEVAKKNETFLLIFLKDIPYIISNFKEIEIKNINENADEQIISNILWMFGNSINIQRRNNNHLNFIKKINGIEDIRNLNNIVNSYCDEIIQSEKDKSEKNIVDIKNALLMNTYGITYDNAKEILSKYELNNIELNKENEKTYLMYYNILNIMNENNCQKLLKVYEDYSKVKDYNIGMDFRTIGVFERQLLDEFAKNYNKQFLKVENLEKISNGQNLNIYNIGTEFKICMTALGAYQSEFENKEDYNSYWNSQEFNNHIISCSVIANNNLSTAEIKNVCLGFKDFDKSMLYAGGTCDLATQYAYGRLYESSSGAYLASLDKMIDKTRGDYNEFEYERKDLDSGEFYKKNPDYIVFLEEFENENIENLSYDDIEKIEDKNKRDILINQKRLWEETVKASHDFGKINNNGEFVNMPILKGNREECAKSEKNKINKAFKEYKMTHDSKLLNMLVTNYQNNRTGTSKNKYIQDKYFSSEECQNMTNEILESIQSIDDIKLRKLNIEVMKKLMEQEIESLKNNSIYYHSDVKEKIGMDVYECIEKLDNMMSMNKNIESGESYDIR